MLGFIGSIEPNGPLGRFTFASSGRLTVHLSDVDFLVDSWNDEIHSLACGSLYARQATPRYFRYRRMEKFPKRNRDKTTPRYR